MSKHIKALAVAGIVLGASAIFASPAQGAPNFDKPTYVAMVKGACPSGSVKISVRKPVRVQWQRVNGVTVSKALKKGAKVCRLPVPTVNPEAPAVVDGVQMRLPANFPAHPTVQDIEALGLTKDSKVDPKLRMGQPVGAPLYTPELADNVDPVAVRGLMTQTIETGAGYKTNQFIVVDWEFTGGKGTMETAIPNPSGTGFTQSFVKLNPNGKTIVTTYSPRQTELNEFGEVRYHIQTPLVPDYGQSNLPPSLTQDWELFRQMVKDESGRGVAAAKNANSANPFWLRADPTAPTSGQLYTTPDGSRMV